MSAEPQVPFDERLEPGLDAGVAARRLAGGRTRTRRDSTKLRDLVAVALAFITAGAALSAYAAFRMWEVGQRDDRRPADAIVVLGAAQYNGRPSAVLAARLDHAIDLYKQGYAPHFVVTGGKLAGDRTTEAATERSYAMSHGVPASAILVENQGRTTLESIKAVRQILDAHGLTSALFVSDRNHMLRVLTMARDQGIESYGSPTATSPSDSDPALQADAFAHELGGLALYLFVEQQAAVSRAVPEHTSQTAPPPAVDRDGTSASADGDTGDAASSVGQAVAAAAARKLGHGSERSNGRRLTALVRGNGAQKALSRGNATGHVRGGQPES